MLTESVLVKAHRVKPYRRPPKYKDSYYNTNNMVEKINIKNTSHILGTHCYVDPVILLYVKKDRVTNYRKLFISYELFPNFTAA